MSKKEIKKPSKEGLEKFKNKFKELYNKRPSKEIMQIISEDEPSQEINGHDDDIEIAASSIIKRSKKPIEEMSHTGH